MIKHLRAYLKPINGGAFHVLEIDNATDVAEAYKLIESYKKEQYILYKKPVLLSIQKHTEIEENEQEAA